MTQTKRRSRLGLAINLALVALAFGLLGLAIRQNSQKIQEVLTRRLDFRWLVAGEAIFLIALVSTFIRWYLLVRVIDPRFKLRSAVLLGFIGTVWNLVIPGAVGGDLIKAGYLVRMRIKKTQAIASMVIDRILGLLGLFVLASIAGGIAWSGAPANVRTLIAAAWTATALGVIVLAVIFSQVLTRIFPRLAASKSRLGLIVYELREMSRTYRGRLDVVATAVLFAMFNHSLNVVVFYMVGLMLYPDMPTTLAQHFLMVPLTLFTMAVPIPFGAPGLTEEVGYQLLKLVGHPSGFLAMIGFRLIWYGSGLVGACVYLVKLREVRELTASAHENEEEPEE
jgi:glycosyltransferase 2 family protein